MLRMDWRKNRIAIGAVVFVVLLGLTAWAVSSRNSQPTSSGDIPKMKLDKAAISTLEITRPGDERVVLSKVDDAWRLLEPVDAAADQNNVESALNRLASSGSAASWRRNRTTTQDFKSMTKALYGSS